MTKPNYIPAQYRIKSVKSLESLFNEGFGVMDRIRGPKLVDYKQDLSGDFNRLAEYIANKLGGELQRAQVIEGQGSSLSLLSDAQFNNFDPSLREMASKVSTDFHNFEVLLSDKNFLNVKAYITPTFKDKALCNIAPSEQGWERYIASYTGESAGHIMKKNALKGADINTDVVAHLVTDENPSPVALPKHNLLLVVDYKP